MENFKFWSKNKTWVKNLGENRGQHFKVRPKTKCGSKIKMLVKTLNFRQQTKFGSRIEIVVKTLEFGQKN